MYLDPGFGGMLVQAIVVIAAVGGGIIFATRKKIRNLFSRNRTNTQSQSNAATNRTAQETKTYEDDVIDTLSDSE